MKTKRITALLMCLLTVIGLIPDAAFAAQSTVTIESQTNSAFDYLEYYKDGAWKDLNTPRHWIEQTGEVVYCVEHGSDVNCIAGVNRVTPISIMFVPISSKLTGLDGTPFVHHKAAVKEIRRYLMSCGARDSFRFGY